MEESNDKQILFGPRNGKLLKRENPELARNKAFDALSDQELLFAWYMGNKSSSIDENWTESVRAKQAAWASFPKGSEKRNKYASMEISVSVKAAIEEMRKYSPEARMQAKKMAQTTFHKWMSYIETTPANDKNFVETSATIQKYLPDLVKILEEGYGISEAQVQTNAKEEGAQLPIDEFHQNKKENK